MTDYDKRYRTAREMLADVQYVLASEDMFAIKPAELPSMGGGAAVASAMDADEIDDPIAFSPAAHHAPPPPLPGEKPEKKAGPAHAAKPKHVRVLNWWTGGFTVSGDDAHRPMTDVPVSVGAPKPAFVRASAPMPGTPEKRPARDQVASARQRAQERRHRAQQRRRNLTGKGGKPRGAGLGIGLAIILVVLPAVAAGLITVQYASSNRTPYEEGRHINMTPPAPDAPRQVVRVESSREIADQIRAAVRQATDHNMDGTLLVVRDATGLSLEQRAMLEHRLAALRAAGVNVLDAHNADAEELEHVTELLATLRASLGLTDPDSEQGSKKIKTWVHEHDDIDAIYWIAADEHDAAVAEPLMRAKGETGESILRALRQLP
jgi:hypothetical protein